MQTAELIVAIAAAVIGIGGFYTAYRRQRRTTAREAFRAIRDRLPMRHQSLVAAARRCYPDVETVSGSELLTRDGWKLERPIADDEVKLTFVGDARVDVTGDHPAAQRFLRPLGMTRQYTRYSEAVLRLVEPKLFVDRFCYRLLNVDLSANPPRLVFGETSFFQTYDVAEALVHETACLLDHGSDLDSKSRKLLPRSAQLRRALGDPFDLARRPYFGGIETLALRVDGDRASFRMHERSGKQVAVAGGLISVAPTGIFQPAAIHSWDARRDDFDLWRNTVREFAEEYLGVPEAAGEGGRPLDYNEEPYVGFMRAKQDGQIRHWILGAGVDPLALSPKLLCAAVFDARTYDRLGLNDPEEQHEHSEGTLIGPERFEWKRIDYYCAHRLIAPGSAACLRLAWKHRDQLLAQHFRGRGVFDSGIEASFHPLRGMGRGRRLSVGTRDVSRPTEKAIR